MRFSRLLAAATVLVPVAAGCGDDASVSGPATSGVGTTATSVVEATSVPLVPSEVDDLLARWPSPASTPLGLADIPMLLPSVPIPGTPIRWENGPPSASGFVDYSQHWIDAAGGVLLSIQTDLAQGYPGGGDPVTIAPWDSAYFATSTGTTHLVLNDPSGVVSLWSNGLDREQMTAIAASLRPRSSGAPGWDAALPAGFTPVHEGWEIGGASRWLQWSDAELSIMGSYPSVITNAAQQAVFDRVTDIDGAPALVYGTGEWSAVSWSPAPDIVVVFAAYGTPDEVLLIARSVAPVDQATWNSASTPAPLGDDGCSSHFFC
jgi:hypothetical protein